MRARRGRIWKTLAAAALGAATLGVSGVALASAPGSAACADQHGRATPAAYRCAASGDLLDVTLGDVRATQPSLGYDEVYYNLGRYAFGKDEVNKKFDDWCETNGQGGAKSVGDGARLDDPSSFECEIPVGQETDDSEADMKSVVIGPNGVPYLVDGHHTLTSFYELADGGAKLHLRLKVLDNLSQLSPDAFWDKMKQNKWVWLKDVDGNAITPDQLPDGVGLSKFVNDKYRGLLYFGRDIGYESESVPFQEFYWGTWLRDDNPVDWNADDLDSYLDAVKSFTKAQTDLPSDTVIGDGQTAKDLGALKSWDGDEFDKLSKTYDDDKPGKLAYALKYKASL
ncbi:ParB/Srx family N-terminal domain-containing protein [Stackebrandtia sp.]|jgi:hypothetical protein|uniref:ParB/Srx family N-terminal domain-containing protein n=1 Tax=Stackebrandtia sp. TaxID=2023065 RepID=UPI0039C96B7F